MIPASKHIGPIAAAGTLALSVVLPAGSQGASGEAKGTLRHKGKAVTLTHAYLVSGPDAVDAKKMVRRLILSGKDLGAKMRACQTMSRTDGEVTEGLVVDIDGGPRLNYWMAISGQKVLAEKLSFDDTPSSGPKVDVEFDAALVKELKAAR